MSLRREAQVFHKHGSELNNSEQNLMPRDFD